MEERKQFDLYATQKTYGQFSFNLALLVTNCCHLKVVLDKFSTDSESHHQNVLLISSIIISLVLQIFITSIAIFLAKSNEKKWSNMETRKILIFLNNLVTVFSFILLIFNSFINIFLIVYDDKQ